MKSRSIRLYVLLAILAALLIWIIHVRMISYV